MGFPRNGLSGDSRQPAIAKLILLTFSRILHILKTYSTVFILVSSRGITIAENLR